MPTYEYACAACGNAWEEIQKITEPPVEVCPSCKKATAKRQISGGSFILKGGGWYADLYSSSGGSKSKDDASSKSTDASAKTETKSETKSESKPETSGGSGGSGTTGSSPSKSAAE